MDTTIWIMIGVGVLLAAGGGFFLLRLWKSKEEPILHFRCPGCRRRLRYQSRQVGHKGMCNFCKTSITFPPVHLAGH